MKLSRKYGLIFTAFCIMALLTTVAVAADASGPVGPGGNNPPPQGGNSLSTQGGNNPLPIGANGNQEYSMTLTLSDQAQRSTIAFDALAFLTGDACSDTFLPPGKVADYAGFQYLRDNDATQMGHNTDFVTRAADNVLYILNNDQIAQYIALSKEESALSQKYGYMRFPLANAFRTELEGKIPSGSSGLDKSAVMNYSAQLYDVDATISLERAKTYAKIIRSLNETQRAYLDKIASGGMLNSPVVDVSEVLKNSGQDNSVAMRTYASEMFAWYAGSVTADVYFCPERQATYFGSFYMKDRPAMGNPDYYISTTLTGDSGEAFLALLTDSQREKIISLVDTQRADLNEIVAKREAIATELRTALSGDSIDEGLIRSLSARYGELDGEISYYYAKSFAEVGKTLTAEQKQKMIALRNLDGVVCDGAYLYSQPVSMPQNIPVNFLFGVGEYDANELSAWLQKEQANIPSVTLRNSPPNQPTISQSNKPTQITGQPGQTKSPIVKSTITNPGARGTLNPTGTRSGYGMPITLKAGLQPTQKTGLQLTQKTGVQPTQNLPPTEAIQACKGKAIGTTCKFESRDTTLSGICDDKPGVLACAPERNEDGGGQPTETKPVTKTINGNSAPVTTEYSSCINNTKDNPECKDCCDCLTGVDGETRTECRDTCAVHDFSKNTELIKVSAPSVLGLNGDYSGCVEKGSSSECKSCCEGSMGLQCGDYQYCRTACNNKFGDSKGTTVTA